MSIIIGIDPGLSATGYGIIESAGGNVRYISHGVINTTPDSDTGGRLLLVHNELKDILVRYAPDQASVENLYFAKNIKTAIPVAQARGVILFTLALAGIPIAEYTPQEVKQSVTGRGRADKAQIQVMMKVILKLDRIPTPDHAADALAIAFCHSSHSGIFAVYH